MIVNDHKACLVHTHARQPLTGQSEVEGGAFLDGALGQDTGTMPMSDPLDCGDPGAGPPKLGAPVQEGAKEFIGVRRGVSFAAGPAT